MPSDKNEVCLSAKFRFEIHYRFAGRRVLQKIAYFVTRARELARTASLIFIVGAAVLWFGGLTVLTIMHRIWPPAPRVEEEAPPLGGLPIRIVMAGVPLDVPRIGIVQLTVGAGADQRIFRLSTPADRLALWKLEQGANGARIGVAELGLIFYTEADDRCDRNQKLAFVCDVVKAGQLPFLTLITIQPHRVWNTYPNSPIKELVASPLAKKVEGLIPGYGSWESRENFYIISDLEPEKIVQCRALLFDKERLGCHHHGNMNDFEYRSMFSFKMTDSEELDQMLEMPKKIISALKI